jgi:hypothetical protein
LGTVPVPLAGILRSEDGMKTNWEHQKKAITTDQKFRTDDEHLHELDKRQLKESEAKDPALIPKQGGKPADDEEE